MAALVHHQISSLQDPTPPQADADPPPQAAADDDAAPHAATDVDPPKQIAADEGPPPSPSVTPPPLAEMLLSEEEEGAGLPLPSPPLDIMLTIGIPANAAPRVAAAHGAAPLNDAHATPEHDPLPQVASPVLPHIPAPTAHEPEPHVS